MLAADWQACMEIARQQARDGSHLLDLSVDYVGRDGVVDMRELAARFAAGSTLPIMLDSTEPAVIEAGLEALGGRCVVNSVNFEDGDGPTFPISTGQEETRRDGIETINAIREISRRYPGVNFTLGISNVSFGLNPAARQDRK